MSSNITTVVAVDREHLAELREVWPTWQRWHAELMDNRLVLLVDCDTGDRGRYTDDAIAHGNMLMEPTGPPFYVGDSFYDPEIVTQKNKMLSSLLFDAPSIVETKFWIKIDTDTIATGPGPPLTDFVEGVQSIAAPPWGYSTPRDSLVRLEQWYFRATGQQPLWTYHEVPEGVGRKAFGRTLEHPETSVLYTPHEHRRAQERAWFSRVIGWISIINTAFSRRVAEFLVKHPPPFISHDTLLWYLAERWQIPATKIKFRSMGWDHKLGIRSIRERVNEVMQGWEQSGQFASIGQAPQPPAGWGTTAQPQPPPPQPRSIDPVLPFAPKQPPPPPELPPLVVTLPSTGTAPPFPWRIKSNPAPVLYELITAHFGDRPTLGAEIGVHQAATSHYLLQHLPQLSLYMVDPWREYEDKSKLCGDKVSGAPQSMMDQSKKIALERTEPYRDRRNVIAKPSIEAASLVIDGTLDWAFIDAAHGYESFCEDFRAWWNKVKSGGLFMGHDLGHRRFKGIRQGLDELTAAMGIKYDVCPNTVWRIAKP